MADETSISLEEIMEKGMIEFLDLSSSSSTNLDHLESIRQKLNTLMGQFVEEWSDKRNPHIRKREKK